MRVGILTGGGDCPGLNAAIRSGRPDGRERGITVVGFRDGWRGVSRARRTSSLRGRAGDPAAGRHDPRDLRHPAVVDRRRAGARPGTFDAHALDGFIVIGGEGTMGTTAAHARHPGGRDPQDDRQRHRGNGREHRVLDRRADRHRFIDRLYSTAESHNRVMVCEVMGRSAGWIGITAGVAGAADVILIPEHPFDIELVCGGSARCIRSGAPFSIVVVSEGAIPVPGTMDDARVPARRQRVAAPGRYRPARGRRDPAAHRAPRPA